MPNHVTTVCTVTGDESAIDAFIGRHIVPDEDAALEAFDFATVIPKPAIVDRTESGSKTDQGFFALTGLHRVSFARFTETPMHLAAKHQGFPVNPLTTPEDYRAWLSEKDPEALEKGALALQCFRETGYMTWYEWNIANWGTKWGAYSFEPRFREPQKFVFKFETAWAFPEPIFEKLTELHPSLTFDVVSIDEGGPEYEGRYTATERGFARVPEDRERYRVCYGEYPDDPEGDEDLN